jgi:hypothetical protein
MIVITNGTSPFSRLVVQHLLKHVPAGGIAVTTAEPDAAADLAEMGIDVRQERFDPSLDAMAFGEGDRVLVVSRPGDTGSGAPAGSDLDAALTGVGASPEVAGELDSIYNDTSHGEWSVATQTLEELLGHDRVPLVDALEAAHREGRGRPAGS